MNKWMKWGSMVVIVLVVAFGGWYWWQTQAKSASSGMQYTTAQVKRTDMANTLSGTGTIAPIQRYDIVPMVKGNILASPFKEGDTVKKGDLLYQFDEKDATFTADKTKNSIDKQKLSIQSTNDSIAKLQVNAKANGRITNFNVKVGDQIQNNAKVGDIINNDQVIAKVGFNAKQLESVHIGQDAQLFAINFLEYFPAKVVEISSVSKGYADGSVLYEVTLQGHNPGALNKGTEVKGIILANERMESPISSLIENNEEQAIIVEVGGTVKQVIKDVGSVINDGDKILVLENDTLTNTATKNNMDMKDLKYSLDSQQRTLEDYRVTSPIDGVVIAKKAKAGDTINNATNASNVLMVVADMSKMTFTMSIDELDIAKVKLDQAVKVTADALAKMTFDGVVTKIAAEGTSSNGVTTYPVEVTIHTPGVLKPTMNVNAEIVIEQKTQVLNLPMEAVQKKGKISYVIVDAPKGANGDKAQPQGGNSARTGGSAEDRAARMAAFEKMTPEEQAKARSQMRNRGTSGGNTPATSPNANASNRQALGALPTPPAGKAYKMVTVGLSTADGIEILEGIDEGTTVYIPKPVAKATTTTGTQGQSPFGGGAPGGMGGGANFQRRPN